MDDEPLRLTVILPTYQRPVLLARALDSIRKASSQPLEVIVVDDDPGGSGFEAARASGARYVHKAGQNRGLSASRNIGLALARGQWLAFLDDDDQFLPGALDRLLAAVRPDASMVYGDYLTERGGERRLHDLQALTRQHLLVCNQLPVGCYLIARHLAEQRFDVRLRSHEDWDFLLCNAPSDLGQHVPGAVVCIDKNENATTSMQARRRQHFWLDFLSIYARFPAPDLSAMRAAMLQRLGVNLPPEMLTLGDQV